MPCTKLKTKLCPIPANPLTFTTQSIPEKLGKSWTYAYPLHIDSTWCFLPCFRLAGKIWKDWFVGALDAKAVSLDIIFGLFTISDGLVNPLPLIWIIMYSSPIVDSHWGINTLLVSMFWIMPLHYVFLVFLCICSLSFYSLTFMSLKFFNSAFTLCIGFIHLRNLMREREAAGNVLMGTTDGEESLSQSPCHVLGTSYPITKVWICIYNHLVSRLPKLFLMLISHVFIFQWRIMKTWAFVSLYNFLFQLTSVNIAYF